MPCPITTVEQFYAHALAIEREAAERYREFAAWFADRDEAVLAGLCRNLASLEQEHYDGLVEACRNLTLPAIDAGAYHWLDEGSPEAGARELFYRVTQPRQILEIALAGEVRARAFFVSIATGAQAPAVRELASIMAAEEAQHVRWVQDALAYHPSNADWETLLEKGVGPGDFSPR